MEKFEIMFFECLVMHNEIVDRHVAQGAANIRNHKCVCPLAELHGHLIRIEKLGSLISTKMTRLVLCF